MQEHLLALIAIDDSQGPRLFQEDDRQEAQDYLRATKWYTLPNASFLSISSVSILSGPVWFRQYTIQDRFNLEDNNTNLTFVLLCLIGGDLDSFNDGTIIADGFVIKSAPQKTKIWYFRKQDFQLISKIGSFFKRPKKTNLSFIL